jgi:non-ribosomal peptide synthetase component F
MTAILRTVRMTSAESFWYVLGCISCGAMYFYKVPVKKALAEAGLGQMTRAEHFWYVVQCIALGAGYLAKIPVKKALSEVAAASAAGSVFGVSSVPQPQVRPGYQPGDWPLDAQAEIPAPGLRHGQAASGW